MRSYLSVDGLHPRNLGIRGLANHEGPEKRAVLLPERDLPLGRIQAIAAAIISASSNDFGVLQGAQVVQHNVDFPALWNVVLLGIDQLPGIAMTLNGEL